MDIIASVLSNALSYTPSSWTTKLLTLTFCAYLFCATILNGSCEASLATYGSSRNTALFLAAGSSTLLILLTTARLRSGGDDDDADEVFDFDFE